MVAFASPISALSNGGHHRQRHVAAATNLAAAREKAQQFKKPTRERDRREMGDGMDDPLGLGEDASTGTRV